MANEWRQAMMNKLTMAHGLRVISVAFASCFSMPVTATGMSLNPATECCTNLTCGTSHASAGCGSGTPRMRATSDAVLTPLTIFSAKGPSASLSVTPMLGPRPHSAHSETHLMASTSIPKGVAMSSTIFLSFLPPPVREHVGPCGVCDTCFAYTQAQECTGTRCLLSVCLALLSSPLVKLTTSRSYSLALAHFRHHSLAAVTLSRCALLSRMPGSHSRNDSSASLPPHLTP